MGFLFKFVFFLMLILFNLNAVFGQELYISENTRQINLEPYTLHYEAKIENLKPYLHNDLDWKKPAKGLNFGITKFEQWAKIKIVNPSSKTITLDLYEPYHHIRSFRIYQKNEGDRTRLLADYGTTRPYSQKEKNTPGYAKTIIFPPGNSEVFLSFRHLHIPLRTSVYLVSPKTLDDLLVKTNSLFNIWKAIMCLALLIAFVMYLFTRHKVFLYYGLLNFGVMLFVGIDIGMFFHFFDKDVNHVLININNMGNILVISSLPYFLNELTPTKTIKPGLWKLMLVLILIICIMWFVDLFFEIRETKFFYWSVWYIMALDVFVYATQIYLLIISVKRKYKNAIILLGLYFFYVFAVVNEVLLPNMGIAPDTIYAYDVLLKISICEVILFLILIGREMNSIFKQRNNLIIKQGELQKQMLKAVVASQEHERNYLGRELHDMIGANMSVLKQNMNKKDTHLTKLIDETIKSIRSLSHGLMTPRVEGDQFRDEIIDLCLLCSSERLKVNYHFHNWKPVLNSGHSTHLFRIIQELLQNAIRHSGASEVYIQFIQENNDLNILYEDNGIGFDLEKELARGKGLLGIKHRADILNAKLRFDSSFKGTNIEIVI